jgi:hypothetical protein
MHIYRHHTAVDVIDLDDRTGLWLPVAEEDGEPIFTGSMPISMRADFSIRGSYAIENEKRCSFYWTDDGELVFRTPDNQRFCLFRREPGGILIDLMPNVSADLQPATYSDGRAIPDMSTFSLVDGVGKTLFEISYDSTRYLQYYLGNFTFVPDEDLSDWDFFVAVKRAVEELRIIARSCAVISAENPKTAALAADVVIAETGTRCPRAGIWVACRHLCERRMLCAGDHIPDVDGHGEMWVWISGGSES